MENISEQKEKTGKSEGRGKDTIFRVAAPNQIELIAIADNKANMIIGICVVLISLVIALLGSGFVIQGIPVISRSDLMVPMCTLLIFALGSAVFAILAAKPEIIKETEGPIHSLLFFQNISQLTSEQYMTKMHQLLEDRQATYDQMIIDMYYNGVVLNRKYKLLRIAYLLFMAGLIITVIAFGVMTMIL